MLNTVQEKRDQYYVQAAKDKGKYDVVDSESNSIIGTYSSWQAADNDCKKLNKQCCESKEYGVRYRQADKKGNITVKEKIFSTQAQLDKFTNKIEDLDGYIGIDSWLFSKDKEQKNEESYSTEDNTAIYRVVGSEDSIKNTLDKLTKLGVRYNEIGNHKLEIDLSTMNKDKIKEINGELNGQAFQPLMLEGVDDDYSAIRKYEDIYNNVDDAINNSHSFATFIEQLLNKSFESDEIQTDLSDKQVLLDLWNYYSANYPNDSQDKQDYENMINPQAVTEMATIMPWKLYAERNSGHKELVQDFASKKVAAETAKSDGTWPEGSDAVLINSDTNESFMYVDRWEPTMVNEAVKSGAKNITFATKKDGIIIVDESKSMNETYVHDLGVDVNPNLWYVVNDSNSFLSPTPFPNEKEAMRWCDEHDEVDLSDVDTIIKGSELIAVYGESVITEEDETSPAEGGEEAAPVSGGKVSKEELKAMGAAKVRDKTIGNTTGVEVYARNAEEFRKISTGLNKLNVKWAAENRGPGTYIFIYSQYISECSEIPVDYDSKIGKLVRDGSGVHYCYIDGEYKEFKTLEDATAAISKAVADGRKVGVNESSIKADKYYVVAMVDQSILAGPFDDQVEANRALSSGIDADDQAEEIVLGKDLIETMGESVSVDPNKWYLTDNDLNVVDSVPSFSSQDEAWNYMMKDDLDFNVVQGSEILKKLGESKLSEGFLDNIREDEFGGMDADELNAAIDEPLDGEPANNAPTVYGKFVVDSILGNESGVALVSFKDGSSDEGDYAIVMNTNNDVVEGVPITKLSSVVSMCSSFNDALSKFQNKVAEVSKANGEDINFPTTDLQVINPASIEEAKDSSGTDLGKVVSDHEYRNRKARVYDNREWEEFVVQFYQDGKHLKKADYHVGYNVVNKESIASAKDDAQSTAKFWIAQGKNESRDGHETFSDIASWKAAVAKAGCEVFANGAADGTYRAKDKNGEIVGRFVKDASGNVEGWLHSSVMNESFQTTPFEAANLKVTFSDDGKKAFIKIMNEDEMNRFNKVIALFGTEEGIGEVHYKVGEETDVGVPELYTIEINLKEPLEDKDSLRFALEMPRSGDNE